MALAERTKFYWPGRYSERALRTHLADNKHRIPKERLEGLTFQDCIDLHDWHHIEILGNARSTPFPSGKQIERTKLGRGETTVETPWHAYLRTGQKKSHSNPKSVISKPKIRKTFELKEVRSIEV